MSDEPMIRKNKMKKDEPKVKKTEKELTLDDFL